MNYKDACAKAKLESGPPCIPQGRDDCTKYVECQIIPSKADPDGPLWSPTDLPSINREGYFTTDWYSGAVVACYHGGKWRDIR